MHPIRTEYGRDALSDTFGECVVAKANEADCGAQTPKSKHREEGGKLYFLSIFINNSNYQFKNHVKRGHDQANSPCLPRKSLPICPA